MKNYGIERKKFKENILYKIAQVEYFLLQYCALSQGMRDYYKYTYKEHFPVHSPHFRENYSIPEGKHCNPVCYVTSDLILRENLPQFKNGLVRLLKKHHSHKFLGVFRSIDELLTSVENMDDTLTWHYSCIDAAENVAALFNNKTFSSGFDYTYFIGIPLKSMKKIQGQYAVLTKDFERKEAVLQHLENYKHETRNQRINYIMLFIAIVTLVLLIFPEWSESIALCLTNIWTRITSLFTEIKHAVLFSVVP